MQGCNRTWPQSSSSAAEEWHGPYPHPRRASCVRRFDRASYPWLPNQRECPALSISIVNCRQIRGSASDVTAVDRSIKSRQGRGADRWRSFSGEQSTHTPLDLTFAACSGTIHDRSTMTPKSIQNHHNQTGTNVWKRAWDLRIGFSTRYSRCVALDRSVNPCCTAKRRRDDERSAWTRRIPTQCSIQSNRLEKR